MIPSLASTPLLLPQQQQQQGEGRQGDAEFNYVNVQLIIAVSDL